MNLVDIDKIVHDIWTKRQEIIDLFCKTFFVSQEPRSPEELRALFDMMELECKMDGLNATYRIKFKEKE